MTNIIREFEASLLDARPELVPPGDTSGATASMSSSAQVAIGGYDWLSVADPSPEWVEQMLLGADPHRYPDGRSTVLICADCREDGCWPMRARILVAREAVYWTDFGNPHRAERDYSGLSFSFERSDYQREISAAFRVVDSALCEVCDHLCAGGINRSMDGGWCRCCRGGERMEPCCCRELLPAHGG